METTPHRYKEQKDKFDNFFFFFFYFLFIYLFISKNDFFLLFQEDLQDIKWEQSF